MVAGKWMQIPAAKFMTKSQQLMVYYDAHITGQYNPYNPYIS